MRNFAGFIGAAVVVLGVSTGAKAVTLNTVYKVNNQVAITQTCPGSITGAGAGTSTCIVSDAGNIGSYDTKMSARGDAGTIGISGSLKANGLENVSASVS